MNELKKRSGRFATVPIHLNYRTLKYLYLLLTFIGFTASAQVTEATDIPWDLVSEQPNIKVYTRTPDDSSIKELRIIAEFEGKMDTLMHLLNYANNYTSWVYKCASAESIGVPDGYSTAYSAITDFPFPLSDRELVAKSNQWLDDHGRLIQHSISAANDIPLKDGIVRIESYEATWVLDQIESNKIHVEYVSSVDPGGNIPAWVVNLAITTGPIKSFAALMKQVKNRCSHIKSNASN